MADKDKVIIEFNKMQLKLLDSMMPFYGSTREEVVKNIIMRWVEQNIGLDKMRELRLIGAIS